MTEIQNPKQLAFDPPLAGLDIVICYFRFIRVWALKNYICAFCGKNMTRARPATANRFYPPHPDKP